MSSRVFDLHGAGGQFFRATVPANSTAPATLVMGDFNKRTISAADTVGDSISLVNCRSIMAQVIVTAVGAALVGGAVKLQGSITGGTQSEAWFDISAAVNVTAIESGEQHIINLATAYSPCQFKFVRLHSAVTAGAGSTFDSFAVLHVRAEEN